MQKYDGFDRFCLYTLNVTCKLYVAKLHCVWYQSVYQNYKTDVNHSDRKCCMNTGWVTSSRFASTDRQNRLFADTKQKNNSNGGRIVARMRREPAAAVSSVSARTENNEIIYIDSPAVV